MIDILLWRFVRLYATTYMQVKIQFFGYRFRCVDSLQLPSIYLPIGSDIQGEFISGYDDPRVLGGAYVAFTITVWYHGIRIHMWKAVW